MKLLFKNLEDLFPEFGIRVATDNVLEKDFNIHLKKHNEVRHMFKLDYNITKINSYLYLFNYQIYNNKKWNT